MLSTFRILIIGNYGKTFNRVVCPRAITLQGSKTFPFCGISWLRLWNSFLFFWYQQKRITKMQKDPFFRRHLVQLDFFTSFQTLILIIGKNGSTYQTTNCLSVPRSVIRKLQMPASVFHVLHELIIF